MAELTPVIWNAIFTYDTYDVVAQELPTTNSRVIKWAGLHSISHYPVSPNNYWFIQESEGYRFCLFIFELDAVAAKYIDETDDDKVLNPQLFRFNTESELYSICESSGIQPEKFTAPWHSNYPFR